MRIASEREEPTSWLAEVTTVLTGERILATPTAGDQRPSRDEIAILAYSFYEMRGCEDGRDVEDWLSAEFELRRHYYG